jgi:hypothetical protein
MQNNDLVENSKYILGIFLSKNGDIGTIYSK